jgi:hypothetical protein
MYLANIITRSLFRYKYQFAICESCFWCPTVFHKSIIKQGLEEYVYQNVPSLQWIEVILVY